MDFSAFLKENFARIYFC